MEKTIKHIRLMLMAEIVQAIESKGLSRKQAGKIIGLDETRMSRIFNGKWEMFRTDALIRNAIALGLKVEMEVS